MAAAPSVLETPSSFGPSSAQDHDTHRWLDVWSRSGWLALALPPPSETSGLRDWLKSAVETELAHLGAAARPEYVGQELADVLADQAYRSKMLGFQGLAIALPGLVSWSDAGALSPEDSAALLAWWHAAQTQGTPVCLCPLDAQLRVYEAPVSLEEAGLFPSSVAAPATERTPAAPVQPPEPLREVTPSRRTGAANVAAVSTQKTGAGEIPAGVEASSEEPLAEPLTEEHTASREDADPASERESAVQPKVSSTSRAAEPWGESTPGEQARTSVSPPAKGQRQSDVQTLVPPPNSTTASVSRRAAMRSLLEEDDNLGELSLGELPPAGFDLRAAPARAFEVAPARSLETCAPPASDEDPDEAQDAVFAEQAQDSKTNPDQCETLSALPDQSAEEPLDSRRNQAALPPEVDPPQPITPASPEPRHVPHIELLAPGLALDNDAFAEHIEPLQTSDGSQGWDDIELLFERHYLPLQRAVRDGTAPALAASVLAEWAKDFSGSYVEAFDAIRNCRGKRPRLVLDVSSYAFQLSRKHNAEQLKIVMVDAMRADVGALVLDRLRVQMGGTAQNVASGLLWAALPSNTPAQMELIARGTDGLRHFSGELTEGQLMSRGNDLRRLRPVRVGSHRMYKLDIVQYLVRDTDRCTQEDLEQYAAEVATSVGRFLRQQESGTLVYLFGDHGFGGALEAAPEQVLTPYQAWLTGG